MSSLIKLTKEAPSFLQTCNTVHPTRRVLTNRNPFLRCDCHEDFENKQKLYIKTYTKPTNKQTYVHGSSFHPRGTGKSIALGEVYRFLRTNTDESNFGQQMAKLQRTLLARSYKEKATQTLY